MSGNGQVYSEYRIKNHRADAPESTVWQDIFDKKFKGETANDVYTKLVDVENKRQELEIRERRVVEHMQKEDENTSSSDVSGFSDLDQEEQFMVQKIREQRVQAAQAYEALPKYGSVIPINHLTYKDNVQTSGHVLVHISSDHLPDCKRVNHILDQLAAKFPPLKICKIDYKEANKDFPEKNCPTLLIYSAGQVISSLVGTFQIGGAQVTADELEWQLHKMKIVVSTLEGDPSKRAESNFMGRLM